MNKKAKILSLCLAAVLLCACVVGFMMVGANAANEGYTHTWTVDGTGAAHTSGTPETTKTFATLQEALTEAKACEGQWKTTDTLCIKIATSDYQLPNRTADNILFVQTIWRGDRANEGTFGNKLPITIEGAVSSGTAYIGCDSGSYNFSYNLDQGKASFARTFVFANDYTFKNVTFSMKTSTKWTRIFYAGSGNVTFDNVQLASNYTSFYGDNNTQAAYLGWTKADVEAIMNDNGGLIPSSFTFKNGTTLFPTSTTNAHLRGVAGAGYCGTNAEATAFAASTTGEVPADVATLAKPANCSVGIIIPNDVSIRYGSYYVHYCPDDVAAVADDETTADVDETVEAVTYYPASYGNIRVDVRNSAKFNFFRTTPASKDTKRTINSNTTIHLYQDLSTLQYSTSDDLTSLFSSAIPDGITFDIHLHNGVTYGIDFAAGYYGGGTSANTKLNITVHPNENGSTATYTDGLDLIQYNNQKTDAQGTVNVTIKSGVKINGTLLLCSADGNRPAKTRLIGATVKTTIEEGAVVENFIGPRGKYIINNINGTVSGNFYANGLTNTSSSHDKINSLVEAESITNNIKGTIGNFYGTGRHIRLYDEDPAITETADKYDWYNPGYEPTDLTETQTLTEYYAYAETVTNNIFAGAKITGTFKATSSTSSKQAVTNNIADAQTFASIDATVPGTFVLGENASITVAAIEGKINLSADAWTLENVYLTYTGEDDLFDHLGTTADETGRVLAVDGAVGNRTLVPAQLDVVANLVLTERIAVRVYFNKADVAKIGGVKKLSLTATGLDEIFVSAVQEDEDEYFFDVYGITASDLNVEVTFRSVNGTVKKSLNDILEATKALEIADAEEKAALVDLCKSIQQLGGAQDATVKAESHTLSTEAGVYFNADPVSFDATGYAVAMNDAIGFAIYGTGADYTVTLNGVEVEPQQGEECIYIFVKVSKADNLMDIKITNATTDVVDFRMVASVQDLASLGAGTDTNSHNILAYTQAALAYKKACAA